MKRRFTGWHMLATMIAFFGVVIGVNSFMAVQAARTFGGTVVANSYVASQHFNHWLGEADAQDRLGWKVDATTEKGRPVLALTVRDAPVSSARITGYAEHPLGRVDDIKLEFHEAAAGRYLTDAPLPSGRWRLHLYVTRRDGAADFVVEVHA